MPHGVLLGTFGTSWGSLGASWGPLGASWEPLGSLSRHLRDLLGRSWGLLGAHVFGDLNLVNLGVPFGAPWGALGIPKGSQIEPKPDQLRSQYLTSKKYDLKSILGASWSNLGTLLVTSWGAETFNIHWFYTCFVICV